MDMFYTFTALVIGCICVALVAHPQYEDGLLGRFALGAIALAELSVFWDSAFSGRYYNGMLNTTVVIQAGLALFFVRHFYRFIAAVHFGRTDYNWGVVKK